MLSATGRPHFLVDRPDRHQPKTAGLGLDAAINQVTAQHTAFEANLVRHKGRGNEGFRVHRYQGPR